MSVETIIYEASTMGLSFSELGVDEQATLSATFRDVSLVGHLNNILQEVFLVVPAPESLDQEGKKHRLTLLKTVNGEYVTPCKVLTNIRPGEAFHWLMTKNVLDWSLIHSSQIEFPEEE